MKMVGVGHVDLGVLGVEELGPGQLQAELGGMVSTKEPRETEAMTAEPMATPLVMALVVLPTARGRPHARWLHAVNRLPDISPPGGRWS